MNSVRRKLYVDTGSEDAWNRRGELEEKKSLSPVFDKYVVKDDAKERMPPSINSRIVRPLLRSNFYFQLPPIISTKNLCIATSSYHHGDTCLEFIIPDGGKQDSNEIIEAMARYRHRCNLVLRNMVLNQSLLNGIPKEIRNLTLNNVAFDELTLDPFRNSSSQVGFVEIINSHKLRSDFFGYFDFFSRVERINIISCQNLRGENVGMLNKSSLLSLFVEDCNDFNPSYLHHLSEKIYFTFGRYYRYSKTRRCLPPLSNESFSSGIIPLSGLCRDTEALLRELNHRVYLLQFPLGDELQLIVQEGAERNSAELRSALIQHPNITSLLLRNIRLDQALIEAIPSTTRFLFLNNVSFDDSISISSGTRLRGVVEVEVANSENLKSDFFKYFRLFPNIKRLQIFNCKNLSGEDVKMLNESNLTKLRIRECTDFDPLFLNELNESIDYSYKNILLCGKWRENAANLNCREMIKSYQRKKMIESMGSYHN